MATHGLIRNGKRPPLYDLWQSMRQRCHGGRGRKRYKERGIIVCDRWRFGENGLTGFECFLSDMGKSRPSPKHTLDRIDNNGNYEPGNCRWATMKEQQRNRCNNRRVTFRGREMTLGEAFEKSGLNPSTAKTRFYRGQSWFSSEH